MKPLDIEKMFSDDSLVNQLNEFVIKLISAKANMVYFANAITAIVELSKEAITEYQEQHDEISEEFLEQYNKILASVESISEKESAVQDKVSADTRDFAEQLVLKYLK